MKRDCRLWRTALLNLGHTFAHAIENVAGYGEYLHGEAVAIGMVLATQLSIAEGQLPETALERVTGIVRKYHLPSQLAAPLDIDQLMAAMLRDKKNRGGKLRFVTMRPSASCVTSNGIESELVRKIWQDGLAFTQARLRPPEATRQT